MRFIVVGAGAVGTSLCKKLVAHQHDLVLIERYEDKVEKEAASLDLELLIGNGASPDVLLRAGIYSADYLISVANIDEVNIAACLSAKLLNPECKRIARIRDINLFHKEIPRSRVTEYFDLIINPQEAAADYLAQLFFVPGAKEVVDFSDGKLRVLGLPIQSASPLAGQSVASLGDFGEDFPLLVIALMREGRLIVPRGKDIIKVGDLAYFITVPSRTEAIYKLTGSSLNSNRHAIIWGEGPLARILAHRLEDKGTSVKLIVSDEEHALQFVDAFDSTLILTGDGTDQTLLLEENIHATDAFIAVTPDEENNILASLLAKSLGAKSVMALINKGTYLRLVNAIGIDVAVSSRLAAAREIFRHVHSQAVIAEFALRNLGAGFIEISATAEMPITGKPISELSIPSGILLGAIVRRDEVIIPKGRDRIEVDDHLILFVLSAAHKQLERFLDVKLEFFV